MSDGKTHAELMEQNAVYRKLVLDKYGLIGGKARLEGRIETLEAALQSIKDDYEFCESEGVAGDRAHAYYETVCKALTKEEL